MHCNKTIYFFGTHLDITKMNVFGVGFHRCACCASMHCIICKDREQPRLTVGCCDDRHGNREKGMGCRNICSAWMGYGFVMA